MQGNDAAISAAISLSLVAWNARCYSSNTRIRCHLVIDQMLMTSQQHCRCKGGKVESAGNVYNSDAT